MKLIKTVLTDDPKNWVRGTSRLSLPVKKNPLVGPGCRFPDGTFLYIPLPLFQAVLVGRKYFAVCSDNHPPTIGFLTVFV